MIRSYIQLHNVNEPILALAIHNGHEMHPDLLEICGINETDRLREEDPYTENFASPFSNKIIVYTSRFTIDLNRHPDKAIYQIPDDCWGLNIRTKPLNKELVSELKNDYFQWYELLSYTLRKLLSVHKAVLVLDLHSYNHHRQGIGQPFDPQLDNPDIILGRNNMPTTMYPWVEALRNQLAGKQLWDRVLDCRIDVKFSGGYLSRWLHQIFPSKITCLAIEFKKIFMDEWTGELDETKQALLTTLFNTALQNTIDIWKQLAT